jgi:hypothetical protein
MMNAIGNATRHTKGSDPIRVDSAFSTACDLVQESSVRSVHVLVDHSMSYDTLIAYRQMAAARNLSFMVTKTGAAMGYRVFRRCHGHSASEPSRPLPGTSRR